MGKKFAVFVGIFIAAMSVCAEENLLCPDSPNCVSSIDSREAFKVSALSYSGHLSAAMERLVSEIEQDGGEVVRRDEGRLEAIYTSFIFRFKDELTVVADNDVNLLHVRSRSRTGYYDFGVNRRRVERLRARLNESHQ